MFLTQLEEKQQKRREEFNMYNYWTGACKRVGLCWSRLTMGSILVCGCRGWNVSLCCRDRTCALSLVCRSCHLAFYLPASLWRLVSELIGQAHLHLDRMTARLSQDSMLMSTAFVSRFTTSQYHSCGRLVSLFSRGQLAIQEISGDAALWHAVDVA